MNTNEKLELLADVFENDARIGKVFDSTDHVLELQGYSPLQCSYPQWKTENCLGGERTTMKLTGLTEG